MAGLLTYSILKNLPDKTVVIRIFKNTELTAASTVEELHLLPF
jgi:hypothetical protein